MDGRNEESKAPYELGVDESPADDPNTNVPVTGTPGGVVLAVLNTVTVE